jgi:two-component system, NarL family, nitrate/nitrite response regulator NarL
MSRQLQQCGRVPFSLLPGRMLGDVPVAEVPRERNAEATGILIADDHAIFRDGLRMLLETQPDFRVVGEAKDGEETVSLVRELKPDVLLLDLAMPRFPGLDVLYELARSSTPVRSIVLAAAAERSEMVQAIHLGARAVVLKHSGIQVLLECIHAVMAGRYWVGDENLSDLTEVLRRLLPPPGSRAASRALGLTARELEVVATVASGYTNKDIAQKFSISEHTVKNHLTNIFDKLGFSNRVELALFATEHRLTENSWICDMPKSRSR